MRKLIYIIFFFSSCTKCQIGYLGHQTIVVHDLILLTGESNAEGAALNSDAPPTSIGIRNSVKILYNINKQWQTLNIGISGNNQSTSNKHGLELGLANSADTGLMSANAQVYLVKTGIGGTRIRDWFLGTPNWTTLITMTDTAIGQLTRLNSGTTPKLFIWYNQGQNDKNAGMDSYVWKDTTKLHFANLRTRYGATVPIFITLLTEPTFSTYNDRIREIASELTNTFAVPTPPADDGSHWNYSELLTIAYQFISVMRSNYNYR